MSVKQDDEILTDTPIAPVAGAIYSGGVPGETKVIAVDANGVVQTSGGGGGGGTVDQGTPAATADRWPVQVTDGTDLALVTAAGELNVIATAQPGVDIGDVTVNNASGASAVNIQDGGNSLTIDGSITSILTSVTPGTGSAHLGKQESTGGATGVLMLGEKSPGSATYSAPTVEDFDSVSANQMAVHVTNPTLAISGIIPGTSATSLGKAEDTAAASGDVGVVLLAQRHDAFTSTVSANEDYSTLHVNSVGQLKVSDAGLSALSDGSLLANVWDNGTGQTGRVQDFDPGSGDSGLVVRPIPNSSIPTTVTGTVSVSGVTPGTGATNLGKAEDAAHASGDVGVQVLTVRQDNPSQLGSADGDYVPIQTNAAGAVKVILNGVNGLPVFTNPVAGIYDVMFSSIGDPVTLGIASITNSALFTQGNVAHDAADSSNPVKVGGRGIASLGTAVAAADRTDFVTDLYGRQYVVASPDANKRLGVYYYQTTAFTVQAAADAATVGRCWLINPVGSAVTVRIRKIYFSSQIGSVLVTATSPRINVERTTFTGTASGATIAASLRKTSDAAAVSSLRTASTGLALTAGNVVTSFFPVASYTAVGAMSPAHAEWDAYLEDYIELAAGEGLIVRQADAGTAADTRRYILKFIVEEF